MVSLWWLAIGSNWLQFIESEWKSIFVNNFCTKIIGRLKFKTIGWLIYQVKAFPEGKPQALLKMSVSNPKLVKQDWIEYQRANFFICISYVSAHVSFKFTRNFEQLHQIKLHHENSREPHIERYIPLKDSYPSSHIFFWESKYTFEYDLEFCLEFPLSFFVYLSPQRCCWGETTKWNFWTWKLKLDILVLVYTKTQYRNLIPEKHKFNFF